MVANFVFVDTETTGLKPDYHEIIDIWCTVIDRFTLEILDESGGLITPTKPWRMDTRTQQVNGYTPEDWIDSRPIADVLLECIPLMKSNIWVGQNPWFDVRFVLDAVESMDMFGFYNKLIHSNPIDTRALAKTKNLGLPNLKMDTMCDALNIVVEGRAHTARADVYRTIELYKRLLQM